MIALFAVYWGGLFRGPYIDDNLLIFGSPSIRDGHAPWAFWYRGQIFAAKQPGQIVLGAIPYFLLRPIGISYERNFDLAAALARLALLSPLSQRSAFAHSLAAGRRADRGALA